MRFPVSIELHRSRLLVVFLVLFHLLAIACLLVVPWYLLIRLVLILLVGFSASYSIHAIRFPSIVGLRLPVLDRLECCLSDGNQHEAILLPGCTVFSRLIVLRLSFGVGKKVSRLTLLPDQMSANEFRILRLWLRWHSTSPRAEKVL